MQTLILAIIVSFAIAIVGGKFIVPALRSLKAGQHVRDDGPQSHLKKEGTPTMGGIIMMLAAVLTLVIFAGQITMYAWIALFGALAYGLIGLIDDMIIVLKRRSLGLRPWQKIFLQFLFAILIALFAYNDPSIGDGIYIPIADKVWHMGVWYIPFNVFVILALTNSVNLTDGLDGLAGSVTLVNAATYVIIFFSLIGTYIWAKDLMIFAAVLAGAILGFLRFNSYPAQVFMGDTGAFFLGGALCMLSIISRMQILIPFMGLMYVASSVSCILQVGYFKLTHGKRIFKMAPLHHHFELKGMHETKVVAMYTIVSVIMCMIVLFALTF